MTTETRRVQIKKNVVESREKKIRKKKKKEEKRELKNCERRKKNREAKKEIFANLWFIFVENSFIRSDGKKILERRENYFINASQQISTTIIPCPSRSCR